MSGPAAGQRVQTQAAGAGAATYNADPDSRPPRGENLRQRYGGGYLPYVARRRGPVAPLASMESLSIKSLDISPPDEATSMPQQQQQQLQQQPRGEVHHHGRGGPAWREEGGAHYQYSGYDAGGKNAPFKRQ